jgi:hypothetical protein
MNPDNPLIGGVFTSLIVERLVYLPIYSIGKWCYERKAGITKFEEELQHLHKSK